MSALGNALEAESELIADALHVLSVELDKGLAWRLEQGKPQDLINDRMRNRRNRALNLRAAIERLT